MRSLAQKSLNRVLLVLLKTLQLVTKRWRLFLGICAFILPIILYQIQFLKVQLSFYDVETNPTKSALAQEKMEQIFQDNKSVSITIYRENGKLTNRQACLVKSWLREESMTNIDLAKVNNPFELKQISIIDNELISKPLLQINCDNPDDQPLHLSAFAGTAFENIVTNLKGQDLSFEFKVRPLQEKGLFGTFNPQAIENLWKSFSSAVLDHSDIKATIGGPASYEWHIAGAFKRDNFFNLIVVVVILLGMRIFFGTWKSGIIFISITTLTVALMYALMAIVGVAADSLNNCMFLITCLAGLEDFIYVSAVRMQMGQGFSRKAFRQTIGAGFFTTFTAFIGFISLGISSVPTIAHFGVFCAIGAVLEFIVTFFIWPAMSPKMFNWTNQSKAVDWGWMQKLTVSKIFQPVGFASLALLIVAIPAFFLLKVNDFPQKLFPEKHLESQFYAYNHQERGWEGVFYLVSQSSFSQEDWNQIINQVKLIPGVSFVRSPYDFLNDYLKDKDSAVKDLITRQWRYSNDGKNVFADDNSRTAVFINDVSMQSVATILKAVDQICSDKCFPAGELVTANHYLADVSTTLFESLAFSLALVGFILFWLAQATYPEYRWVVLVSAFWSPLCIIGLLAIFNIPLNLLNGVFAATLVGLTGDNAIQYLLASRKKNLESSVEHRGVATVQNCLLMIVISLLFLGMTLAGMQKLGILLAIGISCSLYGDLWLLKFLIIKVKSLRVNSNGDLK